MTPPRLDVDLAALGEIARSSGVSVPQSDTPFGPASMLSYRVFVSEAGEILDVVHLSGPDVPAVEEALRQARVLAPGRRAGVPVPVAVLMTVRLHGAESLFRRVSRP